MTTKAIEAWSGAFGDSYVTRNAATGDVVRARTRDWAGIVRLMAGAPPKTIAEIGANIGLNLRALKQLTGAQLHAIEPNAAACKQLASDGVLPATHIYNVTGDQLPLGDGSVDLAFTCGVLMHLDRPTLKATMDEMHRVSRQYIFCAEYFAPKQEDVPYRGEMGLLYRDDYGGLFLDGYRDLRLVDCGFFWKRTTSFDSTTWWLLEKIGRD
jgi:pseudaminic acid biosynthesis-associated methylase